MCAVVGHSRECVRGRKNEVLIFVFMSVKLNTDTQPQLPTFLGFFFSA